MLFFFFFFPSVTVKVSVRSYTMTKPPSRISTCRSFQSTFCILCCRVNLQAHLLNFLVSRCPLAGVQGHCRRAPVASTPSSHSVEQVERVINLQEEHARVTDCITVCLRRGGAPESWLNPSIPSLFFTLSKRCHLVIRFLSSCFLHALKRHSLDSLSFGPGLICIALNLPFTFPDGQEENSASK